MTELSIFFLILFAALLHATWNLLLKSIPDSLVAIAMMNLFQSIIFIPIIFFIPLPTGITWYFILGSVILHNVYFINLGRSYNKDDLTLIYPIARGCAPVLITIISLIILKEKISLEGIIGILLVSAALFILTAEHYKKKFNFYVFKISIFIAILISMYTLFDALGVRSAKNSFIFIAWIFFLEGWVTFAYVYFQKKKFYKINSKAFILICLGSVLSFSAYAIILWSYKYLPAGYVASLRESSIIMATILALFFLKEKVSKLRITSACIFFIGVVFIYNS
tara:strand:+ start:2689 stop:3528 length:840 start_codon:yes stop_codon:yes gene_type:complete